MNPLLEVRSDGPLRVLTLNDPARANPLSPAMAEALTGELETAAGIPEVRAVIVAGAGRHFSAGADLAALEQVAAGDDPAANLADSRRLETLFATLLESPKLTVAAVSGAAVAGGCGLATACDLVVADRTARFAYTEVRIGFVPALVSTFLARRVPGQAGRRLLLDPEMVGAERALALGLADEVVESDPVGRARELALELCRRGSPSAIAATKRLLLATAGMGWREALAAAAKVNADQRRHPECRRGVRSFLEVKATPDWLEEG